MECNLLDRMLNSYLESQMPVTITLQNKIRVSGKIRAFDSYVIVVEGQKREIVYRHAVSCLAASAVHEARRPAEAIKQATVKPAQSAPRPAPRRTKPAPAPALYAASSETSINTSMKEGLLKWIQGQKSAK
jgi:RNA chaperone Hfq